VIQKSKGLLKIAITEIESANREIYGRFLVKSERMWVQVTQKIARFLLAIEIIEFTLSSIAHPISLVLLKNPSCASYCCHTFYLKVVEVKVSSLKWV